MKRIQTRRTPVGSKRCTAMRKGCTLEQAALGYDVRCTRGAVEGGRCLQHAGDEAAIDAPGVAR